MRSPDIDLDAYVERIGYRHALDPTLATLSRLQARHTETIPFENLSPLLGENVRLDAAALQNKLIVGGRGGYCYEQNLLFLHVLRSIGFVARGLAARVRWNAPEGVIRARTHMLLLVEVEREPYLVDVGFGGMTPTAPLHLHGRDAQRTPHERFRLGASGGDFLLEVEVAGEWKPVYTFDLQQQCLPDYELASWYLSHHPESHFVTGLIAARPAPGCRHALYDNRYTCHRLGGESEQHLMTSVEEIRNTLQSVFGIRLPANTGLEGRLASLLKTEESV